MIAAPTKRNAWQAPGGFVEASTQRCNDTARSHDAQAFARPTPAQVARLQLTARCLDLSPVFIGDAPLAAELFNGQGRRTETWVWP